MKGIILIAIVCIAIFWLSTSVEAYGTPPPGASFTCKANGICTGCHTCHNNIGCPCPGMCQATDTLHVVPCAGETYKISSHTIVTPWWCPGGGYDATTSYLVSTTCGADIHQILPVRNSAGHLVTPPVQSVIFPAYTGGSDLDCTVTVAHGFCGGCQQTVTSHFRRTGTGSCP
jgi:hypothetical protein